MKTTSAVSRTLMALALAAASSMAARGQSAPASTGKAAEPAAIPIVRLPVPAEAKEAAGEATPAAPTPGTSPAAEGADRSRPASFGFQTGGVDLRSPGLSSLKTNGPVELKGPVPKMMRPQRRTFGGFVTSFGNLFNPLAPVGPGEASTEEHRYDGRVNRAPLPKGFRDERFHEPQAVILGVGLDGEAKKVEDKPATPRKTPVP